MKDADGVKWAWQRRAAAVLLWGLWWRPVLAAAMIPTPTRFTPCCAAGSEPPAGNGDEGGDDGSRRDPPRSRERSDHGWVHGGPPWRTPGPRHLSPLSRRRLPRATRGAFLTEVHFYGHGCRPPRSHPPSRLFPPPWRGPYRCGCPAAARPSLGNRVGGEMGAHPPSPTAVRGRRQPQRLPRVPIHCLLRARAHSTGAGNQEVCRRHRVWVHPPAPLSFLPSPFPPPPGPCATGGGGI